MTLIFDIFNALKESIGSVKDFLFTKLSDLSFFPDIPIFNDISVFSLIFGTSLVALLGWAIVKFFVGFG